MKPLSRRTSYRGAFRYIRAGVRPRISSIDKLIAKYQLAGPWKPGLGPALADKLVRRLKTAANLESRVSSRLKKKRKRGENKKRERENENRTSSPRSAGWTSLNVARVYVRTCTYTYVYTYICKCSRRRKGAGEGIWKSTKGYFWQIVGQGLGTMVTCTHGVSKRVLMKLLNIFGGSLKNILRRKVEFQLNEIVTFLCFRAKMISLYYRVKLLIDVEPSCHRACNCYDMYRLKVRNRTFAKLRCKHDCKIIEM